MLAELDPEDRANYEKKRDLLKRINQSQEKVSLIIWSCFQDILISFQF